MIYIDETKFSDDELKTISSFIYQVRNFNDKDSMLFRVPWQTNSEWHSYIDPFLDSLENIETERKRRIDISQEKEEYENYLRLKQKYEG